MNTLKITIEDEEIEVNVPSGWDEITVGEYAEIQEILSEKLTPIERSVRILAKVTGLEEDIFYMMSPDEFFQVGELVKFMNEEVEKKQLESLVVDGEEYFPKDDFGKLTMGEMISIELLIEQSNNNVLAKLPEMLCIFLRKKKENGKLEAFKNAHMERAEKFRDIKISEVNHLFFAFSTGENSLGENMKGFSESLKKEK